MPGRLSREILSAPKGSELLPQGYGSEHPVPKGAGEGRVPWAGPSKPSTPLSLEGIAGTGRGEGQHPPVQAAQFPLGAGTHCLVVKSISWATTGILRGKRTTESFRVLSHLLLFCEMLASVPV